jgi:drug/metabolite transporter (DMT)-like permease
MQLIWAIGIGYWVFDEVPDSWVIIGASIIVGAVTYLTHREAQAARRRKLKAATMPVSPG